MIRNSRLPTRIQPRLAQIRRVAGQSLYRNALFYAANVLFLSVGGFIFWALAARIVQPDALGLAAGMLAAAVLIAKISELGLGFGIIKFLSHVDSKVELVNSAFSVAGLLALVLTVIFLLGLPLWSPALLVLRERGVLTAAFVILCPLQLLYQLSDQIFVAARRTEYAVIKNGVGSISKLALFAGAYVVSLISFASIDPEAIVQTLSLSMIVALAVTTGWLLPRAVNNYTVRFTCGGLSKDFVSFSLKNHVANLLQTLPHSLLPLLILHVLGASAAGYFFVAWNLIAAIAAVAAAGAYSLFAEGASQPQELPFLTRQLLWPSLVLILVIASALWLLGRPILLILYGLPYANQATTTFQMLALSLLPATASAVLIAQYRARGKLAIVVLNQLVVVSVSISASWFLLKPYGLYGAGLAWFYAQLAALGSIAVYEGIRAMRRSAVGTLLRGSRLE